MWRDHEVMTKVLLKVAEQQLWLSFMVVSGVMVQ